MKIPHLISAGLLMLFAFSCQPKKNTTHNSTMDMNQSDVKMSEQGFKKATVIYSELEGDCPYTLSVEGETTLFDPINLGEEHKKSQTTIWVKYRPLRIPNRCDKANPVEITDINLRK